jgi:hypothetical protein
MAKLSKAKRNARKQVRDIGQTFSEKFAKAQEHDHVDRRAANIAFNLDSLSDEQLHVTYFHLMFYLDDLGITRRATKQEEMFSAGETGAKTPKTPEFEDDEDGKVTRIGAAARKVAEQAGAAHD